jgi:hypothetical protein
MKLGGCFVKYKGEFVQISEVTIDEKAYNEANITYHFPEDSLPFIRFHISPKKYIGYDDFEISFPKDRYIKYNGRKRCYWVERQMSRTYKLAPNEEHYRLPSGLRTSLKKFLNSPDEKPDSIDALFKFPDKDLLLSNDIATEDNGDSKNIRYKNVVVAKLVRKSDHLILKPAYKSKRMPKCILEMFDKYWDIKFPFKAPKKPAPKASITKNKWSGYFNWVVYPYIKSLERVTSWGIAVEHGKSPRVKQSGVLYDLGLQTQRRGLVVNASGVVIRDINRFLTDYNLEQYELEED